MTIILQDIVANVIFCVIEAIANFLIHDILFLPANLPANAVAFEPTAGRDKHRHDLLTEAQRKTVNLITLLNTY